MNQQMIDVAPEQVADHSDAAGQFHGAGMVHADHSAQLPRLRRVEGQVRGIAAMVEGGRYCVDILTQLGAARAALARIERDVLETHANACVAAAAASGDAATQQQKLTELMELLKRSMR